MHAYHSCAPQRNVQDQSLRERSCTPVCIRHCHSRWPGFRFTPSVQPRETFTIMLHACSSLIGLALEMATREKADLSLIVTHASRHWFYDVVHRSEIY